MGSSRNGRLAIAGYHGPALVMAVAVVCTASLEARAAEPSPNDRTFAQPALRLSTFPRDEAAPTTAEAPRPAVEPTQLAADGAAPRSAVPAPASPAGASKAAPKVEKSWPKTVPDAKAEAHPPAPEAFTAEEVAAGRAHCASLLKGLDVVVVEAAPFKSGACGTPAPVQFISVGRNPQVAISPPVTVTCDVVAAMHKWVTQDLQGLAQKHLGASIVGIDTMSSYSCRNAYGRKRTNLSEHGRANAIDIGSFTTSDARETAVLADWGPTAWEIRAQVAAAAKAAADKLAAEKAAADKIAADKAAKAQQTATSAAPAAKAAPTQSGGGLNSLVERVPTLRLPGGGTDASKGFGLTQPSHLGGPKAAAEKARPAPNDAVSASRRAIFLRAAHDAACRIFGTTLGPETNAAHRNHFHVDMAERHRGNYCE